MPRQSRLQHTLVQLCTHQKSLLLSCPGYWSQKHRRPGQVSALTDLLFQSHVHGCEAALIIGVITLTELCGDQITLEGEKVLG